MSKIELDRDIKINGHLFAKGKSVETVIGKVDYEDILKAIMKNTTVAQAEAVAHAGETSQDEVPSGSPTK